MLRIRTTVNNNNIFLDLYKNEPVLLSLSFAELQDITKKNSNYSKAFALPGSKTNNLVFNFFYELNSVPTSFDPNNKFEASLLWDGYEIMQGYIRLNGVSIADGEIIYQVTFYNQIGDLMANIGDKFLYDLDLSCLSHPFSQDVILESQVDYNLFPLTGSTNYSYQNGKTMWGLYNIGYQYSGTNTTQVDSSITPLVQFSPVFSGNTYVPTRGNFDFTGTPVHDYYFKPSIQIKELYTQIVNQAGYNVQSDFFDTAYFQRYYMPLKFVDESIYSRNAIPACYTFTNDFIDASTYNPIYVDPSINLECNSLGWSSSSIQLYIPSGNSGTYRFSFTFTISQTTPCDVDTYGAVNNIAFKVTDGITTTTLYSTVFCDNVAQQISFVQPIQITGNTTLEFYFESLNIDVYGYSQSIVSGPRFIPDGANIDYNIEFPPNDYKQLDFITSINKLFNLIVVPNPDVPNNLIIEPIVDYIGTGPILDWTGKVNFDENQSLYPTSSLLNGTLQYDYKLDQDYANQDFNGQVNRVFGTDKFQLGLQYKDQVTKFDFIFGSPIDITINNTVVSLLTLNSMSKLKQIDISGSTQQTFVPFKILPKTVFRGVTLPNDNYGFIADNNITTAITNCNSGYTINVTTAGYIKYDDCNSNTYYVYVNVGSQLVAGGTCINPTTVNAGFPLANIANFTTTSSGVACTSLVSTTTYQQWYMNGIAQDRFVNLNRFTTYPFNYNNFSHYINYRGEDQSNVTPAEYVFDSEDLYNIYYQPYVNDIISEENKIYSAKVYLYPQDIQRLNWNEKIIVNNTPFRINKITNFNALEPSLCDVEFVKLTKQYTPHRKLYYDLISCADSSHRYSHSDLMFNLYAYIGNYVQLYDDNSLSYLGCYQVTLDTYDPLKTYEHYWLSSGYTPNLVGVYPDCGCTGRTSFNIVQQSACTTNYFWYTGLSCSDSATTYTFKSEDSNLLTGTTVYKISNTGFTYDVCVYNTNPSFIQNTEWIQILSAYTNCSDCNLITPTPTPTPSMTPTLTPTPSSTPTGCTNPVVCMELNVTGVTEESSASITYNDCYGNSIGEVFMSNGVRRRCVEYLMGVPQIFSYTNMQEPFIVALNCNTGECVDPPPPSPTQTQTQTQTPSQTPTYTPSPTIGLTQTPTSTTEPTPTPTQTPTPTSEIPYSLYYADRYLCLNPGCSFDTPSVVVSLPTSHTPQYGKFYPALTPDGYSYLLDAPTILGPGLLLDTNNYTACNDACSVS